MTIGHVVDDLREAVSTPNGTALIGIYTEKSWSGDDDAASKTRENAYTMTYRQFSNSLMTWTTAYYPPSPGGPSGYREVFGEPRLSEAPWDNNDELDLIQRLGEGIRNHDWNAGNSIGAEGKDALKQIAGAASSFAKGMNRLRKGDISGAAKEFGIKPPNRSSHGKNFSSNVLATQLGWVPLMSDIKSASDALYAVTKDPLRTSFIAKKAKAGYYYPYGCINVRCGERIRVEKIKWTLSEGPLSFAEELGLTDPASVVWAGIPFSFISDWFIPIGDYLEARHIASAFKGSGLRSSFRRGQYRTSQNCSQPSVLKGSLRGLGTRGLEVDYSRYPLTQLSVPMPQFVDFKKIPGWNRALTAVALAGQSVLK